MTGTVLMVTAPVLALRSADSTGVQVVHRLASGVPAVEMAGEKTLAGSAWYVSTDCRPARFAARGCVSQPTRGAGMAAKAAFVGPNRVSVPGATKGAVSPLVLSRETSVVKLSVVAVVSRLFVSTPAGSRTVSTMCTTPLLQSTSAVVTVAAEALPVATTLAPLRRMERVWVLSVGATTWGGKEGGRRGGGGGVSERETARHALRDLCAAPGTRTGVLSGRSDA